MGDIVHSIPSLVMTLLLLYFLAWWKDGYKTYIYLFMAGIVIYVIYVRMREGGHT